MSTFAALVVICVVAVYVFKVVHYGLTQGPVDQRIDHYTK